MAKKIKKFEYANLGLFVGKYVIAFEEKLNIITGNNGSGKSTIISGINAVLGHEIDNAESLINKNKIATNLKLVFDDNTSAMLKLLKEDDGIRKMYFINNKYTTKEEVKNYTDVLNVEIIDNLGVTLDSDELKNLVYKNKNNKNQQILVSLQKPIINIADKVIDVEELKQCKNV